MRRVGSLPDLALLRFAVADDAEDLVVLVVHLARHGHTDRAGKALTERAGGDINAGAAVHRGVALEHRALLAQGVELRLREKANACKAGILDGAHMTLGEHHAVAVRPAGILRVDVHVLEVAGSDKVRRRKRAARMTGLRLVDHVNDLHAHLRGGVFQFLDGNILHKNHLMNKFGSVVSLYYVGQTTITV